MRLKLISCAVFAREVAALFQEGLPHPVSVTFLSKGLHELPSCRMSLRLQEAVDSASEGQFDAILLGYGLCSYGTTGLQARGVPLILPRTHDCIAVLLGSHQRYAAYFERHPGAYFRSSGWLERRRNPDHLRALSVAERHGLNATQEQRISQYGAEAGAYLHSLLGDQRKHYDRLAFIETGTSPDIRFEQQAHDEAQANGWQFEKLRGDLGLLRRLLRGDWASPDFLVVPPGQQVRATYDDALVAASLPTKKDAR